MLRRIFLALLLFLPAIPLAAATPRLSFSRVTKPAHAIPGAEDFVIATVLGDTDKIGTFVETLIEQATHAGTVRVNDATNGGRRHLVLRRQDPATERLLKRFPADAYITVQALSCRSEEREGTGSTYDVDRKRMPIRRRWIAALCTARIEIVGNDFRPLTAFDIKGEGASARVETISDEERQSAVEAAARFAAVAAAEAFAPRIIRESIDLDAAAPRFEEGLALIEVGKLDEARTRWTKALADHPQSAPLHFDLAAVCEALSDLACAREHYERALQIAPADARYRHELSLFRRRHSVPPKELRRPAGGAK